MQTMKTLVLYYSYTGHTRKIAADLAEKESASIAEIKAEKRPGALKAYVSGSLAARRMKAWPIQPLGVDLSGYDRLFLLAPVWASFPAPYINSVLETLPQGKQVYVKLVSGSGRSRCRERLEAAIKAKGCTVEGFEDIKEL